MTLPWKVAVNVSMVFAGLPFLDRLDAVAAAGFTAVEFWWPRDELVGGLTYGRLARRLRDADLEVALLNLDGGDFSTGMRGFAGLPGRTPEFRSAVSRAVELAGLVGATRLNALAGRQVPGVDPAAQRDSLLENLRFAADQAGASATITLEALNGTDVPGYLVPTSGVAVDIVRALGRKNVGVQLDVYHEAKAGLDPVAAAEHAGALLAHVQLADNPGRHEPGTGWIAFRALFGALRAVGYQGALGLEYQPSNTDAPDFAFMEELQAAVV